LSLVFTLASCVPKDTGDGEEEPTTDTSNLFSNGDFKTFSTSESQAPFTPTSWTLYNGSLNSEDETTAITSGVINTTSQVYAKDKTKWNTNVPNPNTKVSTADSDPYVLMIYNGLRASRYYNASFSAAVDKYYAVSVDVKTQAQTYAHIRLRGTAWSSFDAIETTEWQTYTFYIEGNAVSSRSVTLELWNGQNIDSSKSQGAVFFDSAVAKEITYQEYEDGLLTVGNNVKGVSLKNPNPDFNASSSTYVSTPIAPLDYTQAAGVSTDTTKANAVGGSSNILYGIVGLDYAYTYATIADPSLTIDGLAGQTGTDGFVLMLNNKNYTAYGYKSSIPVRIERGEYYKISISVKTDALKAVAYDAQKEGIYMKKTDGTYVLLTSAFVAGDRLAIEIKATSSLTSASTVLKYLDVIDSDGVLIPYTTQSLATAILKLFSPSQSNIKNWLIGSDPLLDENDVNNVMTDEQRTDALSVLLYDLKVLLDAQNGDLTALLESLAGDSDYEYLTADTAEAKALQLLLKQFGESVDTADKFVPENYSTIGLYRSSDATTSHTSIVDYRYDGDNVNRYTKIESDIDDAFLLANPDLKIGGTVKLTSGSRTIEIVGINTAIIADGLKSSDGYFEYSFYIKANQFNYTDLTVQISLGEGGLADFQTHVSGFMFVDSLKVLTIDEAAFITAGGASALQDDKVTAVNDDVFADVSSDFDANMIADWSFAGTGQPDGWHYGQPGDTTGGYGFNDNYATSYYPQTSGVVAGILDTAAWPTDSGANPNLPYEIASYSKILYINATNPAIYKYTPVQNSNSAVLATASKPELGEFEILPYSYYRLSVWVKTSDIPANSTAGLNFYLATYEKDDEGEYTRSDGNKYIRTDVAKLENIVTAEDTFENRTNGWVEVVFYVSGNNVESKYFDFEITFGSGTDTETLALGNAYIAYPNMYKISYKDYNAATTSTNIQKYSFAAETYPATSDNTVTNGHFDLIDMENSKIDQYGKLETLGIPSSWTFQDGKVQGTMTNETITKNDVLSGKLDLNDANLIRYIDDAFGLFGLSTTERADDDLTIAKAYSVIYGNNYPFNSNSLLLMSNTKLTNAAPGGVFNANYSYKSPTISLSTNQYYRISVWARLLDVSATAYIHLTSTSAIPSNIFGGTNKTVFKVEGTEWKEYVFYVEVGQSSVSLNLEFWLGNKEKTDFSDAGALFDAVESRTVSDITTYPEDLLAATLFNNVTAYVDLKAEYDTLFADPGADPADLAELSDKITELLDKIFEQDKFFKQNTDNATDTLVGAISFMTDSFDTYNTETDNIYNQDKDEEKGKSLYTPTGWNASKTLGEDATTVAGIVNLDDGSDINRVLEGLGNDDPDLLREMLWSTMSPNLLIIYNKADDSEFAYSSNSKSLSSKTIYQITVYVKLIELTVGKASVYLTLDTDKTLIFDLDNALISGYFDPNLNLTDEEKVGLNGYVGLTFYINNNMDTSLTDVKLTVKLGTIDENGGAKGLIAVDNFTIRKYAGTSADFNELLEAYETAYTAAGKDIFRDVYVKFDTVIFLTINSLTDIIPPDPPVEPTPPDLLWLAIASSVVGGIIVIIIIIYVYQRYKDRIIKFLNRKVFKGRLGARKAPSYDKLRGSASPSVNETRKEYDKYKDD
jgi:hypothetical protein